MRLKKGHQVIFDDIYFSESSKYPSNVNIMASTY